jgi:hypothetical protein
MSDYGLQSLFENSVTLREVNLKYENTYRGHSVVFIHKINRLFTAALKQISVFSFAVFNILLTF